MQHDTTRKFYLPFARRALGTLAPSYLTRVRAFFRR
jgi:hypothetical protein